MAAYFEQYVQANGIELRTVCYPGREDAPVVIYIHGGPGDSSTILAHVMGRRTGGSYTLVFYDQRGAGRTLERNPEADAPRMENMIADLHAFSAWLMARFRKDRLVYMGHSWGSVLGTEYVRRYPGNALAYIGIGQVVDMMENEAEGYRELKRRIEASNNKRHAEELAALGEYPDRADPKATISEKMLPFRRLERKYGMAMKIGLLLILKAVTGPHFGIRDFPLMAKGERVSASLDDDLMDWSLYGKSTEYGMPVYYLLGVNDWQTPFTLARAYLETVTAPDKGLYMIEGAGHNTPFERPDEFCSVLGEVIRRLGK